MLCFLAQGTVACGSSSADDGARKHTGPQGGTGADPNGGGGGSTSGDAGDGGAGNDSGSAGGSTTTPDAGEGGAPDPGATWFGSVGSWCGPAEDETLWLVMNPDPLECEVRAQQIDGRGGAEGIRVELPQTGTLPSELRTEARVCSEAACRTQPIELTFERLERGDGAQGNWRVEADDGSVLSGTFEANWCSWDDYLPPHPEVPRLVRDLRVFELAVFQSVKIPIMRDSSEITERRAQIVAGRSAILRAYVVPGPNWVPRSVRARLTLVNRSELGTDETPEVYEKAATIEGTSSDELVESTINFEIPGDSLREGTRYSLELLETESCSDSDGRVDAARFPETPGELVELGVMTVGGVRIELLPVQVGTLLPDISAEQVERLRRNLVQLFPITGAEITVREQPVATDATTMVDLLDQIIALRDEENPPEDVSYFGLVRFTEELSQYCATSCVLGASVIGDTADGVKPRGGSAVGIGYSGEEAALTFSHEMGHAFGRSHSPCSVTGDPEYPYGGGLIGSWGLDPSDGALKDPSIYKDFMGYCSPVWVSDYVYGHLQTFIAGLNQASATVQSKSSARWRTLLLEPGKPPRWGLTRRVLGRPAGAAEPAVIEDVRGNSIESVTVYRSVLADLGHELVYVPERQSKGSWSVRVRGQLARHVP